jgi:protein gp37
MALYSRIEWTESTWNPVTGCTKISPGCENCYAERMAKRLHAMRQPNYKEGFKLALHHKALALPWQWKRPQKIFVNSMSDLFHERVPERFIMQVFSAMNRADWHIYQILTKRSARLLELQQGLPWQDNIWMGVTVESADYRFRIDHLQRCQVRNKFISFEPLIGPMRELDFADIDWVIVGGESGPGARAIQEEWVTEIRDQCIKAKVPFFFKQWGGFRKKVNGRLLQGIEWNQVPVSMERRENHIEQTHNG